MNIDRNLPDLLSKSEKNIDLISQISEGISSNTYYCRYDNSRNILKYARTKEEYSNLLQEYEACNSISKYSSIEIPKSLELIDENSQAVAIFSEVNTNVPSKKDWLNKDYCRNIIESGYTVLNEMHNNKHLQSNMKKTNYCGDFIDPCSILDNKINIMKKSSILSSNQQELLYNIVDYVENTTYEKIFSHNDFVIINYGLHDGIEPIYDWQTCGYSDPLWDIVSFENAVIDEFIDYLYSDKFTQEMRVQYRQNIDINTRKKRYILYKYVNILLIICVVSMGLSSKFWLNVGSEKDILEHKKEQLKRLEPVVESVV